MTGRLHVALLGPVEARVDDAPVALPGTAQRVLVARLALAAGRVVVAGELVDLLWPGGPPARALGNLHSYVSRLRHAVGTDRVVRQAGGYRLDLAGGDVDIGQVERLVADARRTAPTDPAAAATVLAGALDHWRGTPLADVADTPGFAPDVARLAEWRAHLLGEWLELRLAHEAAAQLLPELEHAARAHPDRERMQLLLMRGLHRDGRTAEALAVADGYRRRLAEEFGLDPGPELAALQQRLLTDDGELRRPAPAPPRASRRFAPRNRFLGRGADLDRLRRAAAVPGLTSLVGPGGVGKTRLAQELLDGLAGPRTFVELAEVSDAADVPATVAASLGLRSAPAGVETAIADRLGSEPAVVVMDNCEHVLDAARRLAAALLARCPELCLVATSRQRLGVGGERVLRVEPLDPVAQVELFSDRAALLRADFDPSGPARSGIAAVCALVDGLALGVELAARREAVFGLSQLRERLDAGLGVLEPARGADRGTALTATVEWSYRLLDPAAQALFDRLAVCRGGFGLDALPHLAPAGTADAGPLLAELVEASLVVPDLDADPPRYRLLETMRRVGAAHCGSGEARAAHVRWMQAHLETVGRLQGERSPDAALLVRRELANLRESLGAAIDDARWEDAGQLAVPLALATSDFPHLELLGQLRRLADAPPTADGALCLVAAGASAWLRGEASAAVRLLTTALDRLPADHPLGWAPHWFRGMSSMYTGDVTAVLADTTALLRFDAPEWVRATAVCNAALACLFSGDRTGAETWLGEHAPLLDAVGAVDGFVAYTRGELCAERDPGAALAWYELAYRQNDERGIIFNREVAGVARAAVLTRLGRRRDAAAACRALVESLRAVGMWPQLWTTLRITAELLVDLGDPDPAAELLDAADADALAPVVHGPGRERLRRLRAGAGVPRTRIGGRTEAVTTALDALARHA